MIQILRDRPWIWIIVAFFVLIGSWVVLLKIAKENQPATVELKTLPQHERAEP